MESRKVRKVGFWVYGKVWAKKDIPSFVAFSLAAVLPANFFVLCFPCSLAAPPSAAGLASFASLAVMGRWEATTAAHARQKSTGQAFRNTRVGRSAPLTTHSPWQVVGGGGRATVRWAHGLHELLVD